MANATLLGRLEKVELRRVWGSEAADFTPWLAQEENLRLLGEALGLELELEGQERNVGPFRADILCRDVGSGNWVLIENQLERTDHTHLGQILTYAAGLNAATIVWIANPFTSEHRAALDWLNEITGDRFNFFGLEIELWRIGGSQSAPKFNIVSQPNDWSRSIQTANPELTPTQAFQVRFWTTFRDFVMQAKTTIRPTMPLPWAYMQFALGRSGFALAAVASSWNSESQSYDTGELRAEVVLTGPEANTNYRLLEARRTEFESSAGVPLIWRNAENTNQKRVYLRRDADIRDETQWPEMHSWLLENLERLDRAFRPEIRRLNTVSVTVADDVSA